MPKGLQVQTTGSGIVGGGQVHKFLDDGSIVLGSGSLAAGVDNKSVSIFDSTNSGGQVNVYGHLTASVAVSASFFEGDGSRLTNIPAPSTTNIDDSTDSDTTYYLVGVDGLTNSETLEAGDDLTFQASTNVLTTANISGSTKLATARLEDVGGALALAGGAAVTIDATTGLSLDAAAASNFSTSAGALTLDGAGGINIGTNADAAIDVDSSTLDIDASGAITVDSTSTIVVSGDGGATFGDDTEALAYDGSGNLDLDAVALDIDASGAVTMTSTTMAFDPSSTFDLDAAGAITIDGASITLGGDSDTPFDIDTSTLDIDASGAVTIDSTSTIVVSGDGGATFGDDTEALVYDGSGNLDLDAVALDIDASGAVTLNGATTVLIQGNTSATFGDDTEALVYDGSGNLDLDAVALDVDASGAVTIDGTSTISIDGADDMNFSIATGGSDAKDLTIASTGGGNSSVLVSSAGTGADALSLDVSAGSMVVAPSLADGQTLKLGKNGTVEMVFTPHGTAGSEKFSLTNTSGTDGQAIFMEAAAGGIDLTSGGAQAINAGTNIAMAAETGNFSAEADGTLTFTSSGDNEIDLTTGGALDLNSGAGTWDATTLSLDGTDDSNLTVTASGKDLDIAVAGGSTQELRLASAGTGASALHLNASAGSVDIDSADNVTVDAADEITLTTTSADGHISLVSAHTAGVAFHIDANANAASEVQIDAGILDVDITGAGTIDAGSGLALNAGAASNFTTSAGALTLTSAAAATWSTAAGVLTLDGAAGVSIAGNAAEIDITTTDALDLNSAAGTWNASTLGLTSTGTTTVTTVAYDHNASGAVTIDTSDTTNGVKVGASTSGMPITLGHTTSEVTVADNLTVTGDLTVNGATTTVSTTNLLVEDKLITLNDGGGANSGTVTGFEIEENGSATGYVKTDGTGDWTFKGAATANAGVLTLDVNATKTITVAGALSIEDDSVIDQDLSANSTSATFAGLSLSDGNITNVGDINADSISVDGAATGLNVDFSGGNTGTNAITLQDGIADALSVTDGSNDWMLFNTSAETLQLGKDTNVVGNLTASMNISASVNISASAFYGDGGNLTGVGGAVIVVSDTADYHFPVLDANSAQDAASFYVENASVLKYNPSNDHLMLSGTIFAQTGTFDSITVDYLSGASGKNMEISSEQDVVFVIDANGAGTQNYSFKAGQTSVAEMSETGHLQISGALTASIGVTTAHVSGSTKLATARLEDVGGALALVGAAAVTVDATTGLSLDAGAASNFSTSAGALTLDGAGGINIGTATDAAIDVDSSTLDIDASGAITVDSTSTIVISGDGGATLSDDTEGLAYDGSGNVDFDAVALDIDASGAVTLDTTSTLSIDSADDSNLTVTASGKDLDIAVAGGSTQELRLASAGTGASALHLNASAGGINVDSADMIDIDAADEITIDTTSADGHIALTSAHTAGQAILLSANADAGSILDVDAGIMDVDVQGAYTLDASGVSIGSDAASNFSTSSGALTLDGAGGINIGTNADAAIDVDSSTLDIDASGAITVDSTSTIVISGDGGATLSDDTEGLAYDGSGNVDFDAVALDIDASGAVTIDGTGTVSIDGADDMNFSIATGGSDAKDLTIASTGGGNSSVLVSSAGTGADALSLDVSAGSMVVAPSLADGQTLKLGKNGAVEMVFTPHGTAGSEKFLLTNTAGTAADAIKLDSTAGGITLSSANTTHGVKIGTATSSVPITIGHTTSEVTVADNLTVTGDLTVNGATTTVSTTELLVEDKLITLNDGGADNTARGSGIEFEENGSVAGFIKTSADGEEFELKVPEGGYTLVLDVDANKTITVAGALNIEADSVINQDLSTDSTAAQFATLTIATSLLPDAEAGADLGSTAAEWNDLYLADDSIIKFGAGQDVQLAHDNSNQLLTFSATNSDYGLKMPVVTGASTEGKAFLESIVVGTTAGTAGAAASAYNGVMFYLSTVHGGEASPGGSGYAAQLTFTQAGKFYFIENGVVYPSPFINE
jgi:hypothetical protein